MTGKELIRQLQKNGWSVDRVNGSHYIMTKGSQTETVPYHTKEIRTGLLHSIMKRTGLK